MPKPKIQSKNFSQWTQQEIEDTFQLGQWDSHPKLDAWLNLQLPQEWTISPEVKNWLTEAQKKANIYIENWTEQELLIKFITPILHAADLDQAQYKMFSDRSLEAIVDGQKLWGRVDLMVAKGKHEPMSPYFCFHEYKQQRPGRGTDPVGQLLATMLVAQALNQHHQPIYGVYIIGRLWHFVILDKRDYAISRSFLPSEADLWDVVRILKGLNVLIPPLLNVSL